MEGIDEEGRTVVREGYADHSENVSVVEIKEVCSLPVESHNLIVWGTLRHCLDKHLLVLLRPITLNPSSKYPSEGPFMSHSRQTNSLPLNLVKKVMKGVRQALGEVMVT